MNIPLNGQSLQKQIPYSRWRMAALEKWKEYELQSILRSSNQVKDMIFQKVHLERQLDKLQSHRFTANYSPYIVPHQNPTAPHELAEYSPCWNSQPAITLVK